LKDADYHRQLYTPFADNAEVQQIVKAAASLASEEFKNITQTLGMVDPMGKDLPLREFYQSTTDWVFNNVYSGVMDHNTAVRLASQRLADKGISVVDYESGSRITAEAAVRRNILGGLGLMVEQVNNYVHDELEADGWEITAHENSAPDHEDMQGKQYSDADYAVLNDSLVRRIGTLNCGHIAFPIILGVNSPQYTEEELKRFKDKNAAGFEFEGKHYTGYEATQKQRALERGIRRWKRRNTAAKATGDTEEIQRTNGKLTQYRRAYKEFSDAAGLRTQPNRLWVAKDSDGDIIQASGKIGDTDGYTKLDSVRSIMPGGVDSEVKAFADKYAYAGKEHAAVISTSGKVYELTGTEVSVNTSLVGKEALKNSAVIHNHPVWEGDTFGDSFSRADFAFSAEYRTGINYLVSGDRINSFELIEGLTVEKAYSLYEEALSAIREQAIETGIPIERDQLEIMQELSKRGKVKFHERLR
jgi:hypothetical protein